MADSFNAQVFDRFTAHAVDLEKFKAGQRITALRYLKKLQADLTLQLAQADLPGYTRTDYQKQRLQALLTQTNATIQSAYKGMRVDLESDWVHLATLESTFVLETINGLAGIELASVALAPETLKNIVSDLVIEGAPSKHWWARQTLTAQNAFGDTVRHGMLTGATNDEIARNVRNNVMPATVRNTEIGRA